MEVFEEQYLIMMANLLKTVQARFEVVLIERGHQLGAARRCPENDPSAGQAPPTGQIVLELRSRTIERRSLSDSTVTAHAGPQRALNLEGG